MNTEQIGSFVLDERRKQKLSQKALAEKAGLSRYQQILEIEKAQFDYGTEVLIKVITALGYKLAFVNPTWEQPSNEGETTEVDEPIVPVSNGVFDFSKAKAATEEDNPDKIVIKKSKAKPNPDSPFKRKRS